MASFKPLNFFGITVSPTCGRYFTNLARAHDGTPKGAGGGAMLDPFGTTASAVNPATERRWAAHQPTFSLGAGAKKGARAFFGDRPTGLRKGPAGVFLSGARNRQSSSPVRERLRTTVEVADFLATPAAITPD
jgi:hypothetical protein